ncbi:MAG: hypothetical protein K6V97_11320 [Actinomycetia bacterium]|nr:hypothetical protein [Actinomycetes bacterium]
MSAGPRPSGNLDLARQIYTRALAYTAGDRRAARVLTQDTLQYGRGLPGPVAAALARAAAREAERSPSC